MKQKFNSEEFEAVKNLCIKRGYEAGMNGGKNPYKRWYLQAIRAVEGIDAMFSPTEEEINSAPLVDEPISLDARLLENSEHGISPLSLIQSACRQEQSLHVEKLKYQLYSGADGDSFKEIYIELIENSIEKLKQIQDNFINKRKSKQSTCALIAWFRAGASAYDRVSSSYTDEHWVELMNTKKNEV